MVCMSHALEFAGNDTQLTKDWFNGISLRFLLDFPIHNRPELEILYLDNIVLISRMVLFYDGRDRYLHRSSGRHYQWFFVHRLILVCHMICYFMFLIEDFQNYHIYIHIYILWHFKTAILYLDILITIRNVYH